MLDINYQKFYNQIISKIPKNRVFIDPLHTLAYGTDASSYRLNPKIVIKPLNENELTCIMGLSFEYKLPITIRTAGTSVCGQASSDSILVALDWGFKKYEIKDNGNKITLEPGVIGDSANLALKPFNKKIGPDPASLVSCMIGGIINNNSSGMCCGVSENSYKTLDSLRIMLYDGTILDTSDEKSIEDFRKKHSDLLKELSNISKDIKNNIALKDKIIQKFKIKNTTGYSINAFVDYDDPIDILSHIIVGSEGTLAILLEVSLRTVHEHPKKASAMIYYKDIFTSCKVAQILKQELKDEVFAAELFDRASLKSIEDKEQAPKMIKSLKDGVCALLIETRAFDKDILQKNIDNIISKIESIDSVKPIEFSDDPKIYSIYWDLRKGLFPTLGETRKAGSTLITEDIVFPIKNLANGVTHLQRLFKEYGYDEVITLGHILEGNLHFVFNQEFSTKEEIEKYDNLMIDICDITVNKYNGSLKGEHGTGRNMAPFVEKEWGKEAYKIMKKVKACFDPHNILNPEVILSDDSKLHIKNLKKTMITNDIVDKCIECGLCEKACPSRELTLTPRQRVVINREMSVLSDSGEDNDLLKELKTLYKYEGNETCTTCSMCVSLCPVSIDMGQLTKDLRADNLSKFQKQIASFVSNNFSFITKSISVAMWSKEKLEKIIGKKNLMKSSLWLNDKIKTPIIQNNFPKRVSFKATQSKTSSKKVVYFPSCISRNMSSNGEEKALFEVIISLLTKANFEIIYPKNIHNLCCGMPFSSKGYKDEASRKSQELKEILNEASNNGEYPILIDTAPCFATMMEQLKDDLDIYEPISFIKEFLLKALKIRKKNKKITIFNTCSSNKMGFNDDFTYIANELCDEVVTPIGISCCGFAGDKGFTHPELNKSALSSLPEQIEGCDNGYSSSITCEIGLSEYGKINYSSIFYLLDECAE